MADLVVFPDTDALARTLLLQELAVRGVTGIGVATKLPSPVPNRFVRLFTLPGRERDRPLAANLPARPVAFRRSGLGDH